MRNASKAVCLPLLALITACTSGYYDVNSNYRANNKSQSIYRHGPNLADEHVRRNPSVAGIYTQPGYYDRNGLFIAPLESGPHIPSEFLPQKGMCRVWFLDRTGAQQPDSEYCADIQGLVPQGAYVIYGG